MLPKRRILRGERKGARGEQRRASSGEGERFRLFEWRAMQHYRQLLVWQKAMDFAAKCYEVSKSFPPEERYGLTSQIKRAAVSVPANLAEGHARFHTREFLNHVSIARGSLAELETLLMLSQRIGFLSKEQLSEMMCMSDEIGRMTSGLRQSLELKLE